MLSRKRAVTSFGLLLCLCLGSLFWPAGPAMAGAILEKVRANKTIRVGVSHGLRGFSWQDANGNWQGLDIDLARAVAAAVLADPGKVSCMVVDAANRFPLLLAGKLDLLLRNTTYTFNREAALGVRFTAIYCYDGQTFMVPADSPSHRLEDLNGASISYVRRTTHEKTLADFFQSRGWTFTGLPFDNLAGAVEAFFAGRSQVLTADRGELAAIRTQAPAGPSAFRILPETISKEPLAAVVPAGDDEWLLIVKWVLYALMEAEERGITQAKARTLLTTSPNPSDQRFLASDGLPEKTLTLKPGWVLRVIEAVGNYGEIYERHLGQDSPLHLDRGLNRLWKDGGLLYAPPFQ